MDGRSDRKEYRAFIKATTVCALKNWRHCGGWVFRSPSGTRHDLSAADINQLDRIEKDGLFLSV